MAFKSLRLPAVMDATGLAKPTIYKLIAKNKFPSGRRLDVRVRIWPEEDIRAYVNGTWSPCETEAA
jgi:prophage regulatory protein